MILRKLIHAVVVLGLLALPWFYDWRAGLGAAVAFAIAIACAPRNDEIRKWLDLAEPPTNLYQTRPLVVQLKRDYLEQLAFVVLLALAAAAFCKFVEDNLGKDGG